LKKPLLAISTILVCFGTQAQAGSILDGLTVDLNWIFGTPTSTPYQTYNPATVGSGFEFTACPGTSYTCSGSGAPLGTALGTIPNNAVSVDVSDTASTVEFLGADNENNTHFSPIGPIGLNGFELSIDEASALSQRGQYVYFTTAQIDSSTGSWSTSSPSIFAVTPTSIFVNFQSLPSGPTDTCSGFNSSVECQTPSGTPNSVLVSFTTAEVSAAPEPASMMLVGTGLLIIGGFMRRRFAN
jgi:hypothetical protein